MPTCPKCHHGVANILPHNQYRCVACGGYYLCSEIDEPDIPLDYVANSPPPEHGGFDAQTVVAAKGAIATINTLKRERDALFAANAELCNERDALRAKLKPSGVCSAHKTEGHWDCTVCYPDWQTVASELGAKLAAIRYEWMPFRNVLDGREKFKDEAPSGVTCGELRLLAAAIQETP